MLFDGVPELLVELGLVPGPGDSAPGLSLDRRQPRRGAARAARPARGSVQALPLPHDHELRERVPKGPEPGQGDRRDPEAPGGAARLSAAIRWPECSPATRRCWP